MGLVTVGRTIYRVVSCGMSMCKDPEKVSGEPWSFPDGKTRVQGRGMKRRGEEGSQQSHTEQVSIPAPLPRNPVTTGS